MGMSFDDIKNFVPSSIAKLNGPSFKDFFIYDGFYEKKWQHDAKDFIISTFKNSCFPKLRENKEVWNKVMDITTFTSDQDIFQKDVIEAQKQETIPFLVFMEYVEKDCHDHNEIEEKFLQDLCNVLYNASCVDSDTLCSKGDMNEYNLFKFLDNPSTAFFMSEKDAVPDLVCIINFKTPDGIVEVPLFLQAKL
ncbi:hypothetical protein RclHR1_05330006 [Rhizophagus clarus]|uniref:Uncharacterized protein n=1 Tax=Rhizophagus clarus TaxID=94130 RepID=A0A2Z6SEM2_9GLOM|nr:hypothetical protein RclHR1_05330006 [Rhizophagus clarus]